MISTSNVSLQYGGRVLFERANVTFSAGNCYGIIGANGAGKSTFLKILSGELEPNKGEVNITPGERLSVLKQDHYAFDEYDVIRTVLMGNAKLVEIMDQRRPSIPKRISRRRTACSSASWRPNLRRWTAGVLRATRRSS